MNLTFFLQVEHETDALEYSVREDDHLGTLYHDYNVQKHADGLQIHRKHTSSEDVHRHHEKVTLLL